MDSRDFHLIERRRVVEEALRKAQRRTPETESVPGRGRKCENCGKTSNITIERGCSLVCACGYQEGCAD